MICRVFKVKRNNKIIWSSQEQIFTCTKCPREFSDQIAFKRHGYAHSGKDNSGCPVCRFDCKSARFGLRKSLCRTCIDGGQAFCNADCKNFGRRKNICRFGCGGTMLCKPSCKNFPGRKQLCPDCGGQSLCELCRKKHFICKINGKKFCGACRDYSQGKPLRKELKVLQFLKREFKNQRFQFRHNRSVPSSEKIKGIKAYRPDFLIEEIFHKNGLSWRVIIEVDEFSHRALAYRCDQQRMSDISLALGDPVIFIRFNPDGKNIDMNLLKRTIIFCMNNPPVKSLSNFDTIRLFY